MKRLVCGLSRSALTTPNDRVSGSHISESAARQIEEHVAHIQRASGSLRTGWNWADWLYKRFETLSYQPERYEFAPEQTYVDYEVRRLITGNYLATYFVVAERLEVHILSFRHGSRLPRSTDLPPNPPS